MKPLLIFYELTELSSLLFIYLPYDVRAEKNIEIACTAQRVG